MEMSKIDVEAQKASGIKGGVQDGWDVDFTDDSIPDWKDLTGDQKAKAIAINVTKIVFILGSLYLFICSLSFLADAFRLVAGKKAGEVFGNSEIFNNPVAALMVGVLVTVLVQSSSTSTSITITMVAADLLTVKQAIPIIMGANIGTSVTSTIVCLGQVQDSDEFRRAFAAATIHDMFNFLTVAVLLPLEAATGYLFHLSKAIISSYTTLTSQDKPPDMLKVITKPFTKFVMQVDKKLISKIAAETNSTILAELNAKSLLKKPSDKVSYMFDGFYGNWSDEAAGAFMLFFALTIMCITLYAIVALLRSLLKGHIAVWLHNSVNHDVKDIQVGGTTIPMAWVSGYLAMGVGMGLTIMVQSSSITTSALTPLVGVGVIRLERMYPTVLGANIGTTITGVLAALAASGDKLQYTLQVAYAHLFFNISGIFLFYVLPFFRHVPLVMAKGLGNITIKYKWYPLAYIFTAFMIIPAIFTLLGMAGDAVVVTAFVIMVLGAVTVATINWMQDNKPEKLPEGLRNWNFLPEPLRSLAPIDRIMCAPLVSVFKRTCGCCIAKGKKVSPNNSPRK